MTQLIDIWKTDFLPKQSSEPFLRQVLANYLKISSEKFVIARSKFGKPFLQDFTELQFNLSHSGEKLLLAISYGNPVGIDIEKIKFRSSVEEIVKRCFSETEKSYWFHLSESEKLRIFYNFWTRKEAVVKGIGRGIALGLNQCEINVNQPNQFLNLPDNEIWYTHSLEISSDYCAMIATQFDEVTIHYQN